MLIVNAKPDKKKNGQYDYLDLSMTKEAAYQAIKYGTTLSDRQELKNILDQTMNFSEQRSRTIERRISLPATSVDKNPKYKAK